MSVPGTQALDELTTLTVTNTAFDTDVPANVLTFSLLDAPMGMAIDARSGIITWTPSELQGPGTNLIIVKVEEDGAPALGATNTYTVLVNEVNLAPKLAGPLADRIVNPDQPVSLSLMIADEDLPTNVLTFSLVDPPSGAAIDEA